MTGTSEAWKIRNLQFTKTSKTGMAVYFLFISIRNDATVKF